ncbi:MAG: lipopolysaccharide biosynthesis protein [Syntrophobacteraceae bacterium]
MNDSLRIKTTVNLSYNLLSKLFTFSLAAATAIVFARKLSPNDYGIVGFAMIFIDFLGQFSDMGITCSIIQKESVEERDLYTAFTLKILFALILFFLSFIWGSVSQRVFDNPAVRAVIIVLAAGFPIGCLGFLPTTALSRELKFKRLTVPQIGSQVAATAVALAAIYTGFRYWSIVFSSLASGIAFAAIVYALRPVPFKLKWDSKAANEQLKFGAHIFLSGFMSFLVVNADNFITGSVAGAAVLGFYAVAFNWTTKAPGLIVGAIGPTLLSTFSRVQQETERLKRGYLTILEYVSFAAILANVLLLVLSREMLTLVLGGGTGKWLPALAALKILCVYGALRAILEPVGSMIIAIGRPALMFRSTFTVAALEIACLYPALRYFGIEGVALVVTFSYAVQFLIYFPALRREIGLRYSTVFRSVRPALLCGGVLAAFGFALDRFIETSWFSLAVKLTLGCSLYLVTYGCITKWRMAKDAREIIGAVLLKASRSSI